LNLTEELIALFSRAIGEDEHPSNILESASDEVYQGVNLVDQIFIDEHRWVNSYEFIYHIPGERRYVCVSAGLGKTEYQDYNEIYGVMEVFKQAVTTYEYVTKDKIRAK